MHVSYDDGQHVCAKVLAAKMDKLSHRAGCHKFLYWKRKVLLCSDKRGRNAKKVTLCCVISDFSAHIVKGEGPVVPGKVLHILVVLSRRKSDGREYG